MSYRTIVKVPPTSEPITTDEARDQLRIDLGDDHAHLVSLISIARDRAEKFCNRFFTEQTISIVYDSTFSGSTLCLPYPDLQGVSEIRTYLDGAETVIDSGTYTFNSDLKRIYFSTVPDGYDSFAVDVVTGAPAEYGGAKIAMLMMLADLYELRTESVVQFTVNENPAVVAALYPYRINIGV